MYKHIESISNNIPYDNVFKEVSAICLQLKLNIWYTNKLYNNICNIIDIITYGPLSIYTNSILLLILIYIYIYIYIIYIYILIHIFN